MRTCGRGRTQPPTAHRGLLRQPDKQVVDYDNFRPDRHPGPVRTHCRVFPPGCIRVFANTLDGFCPMEIGPTTEYSMDVIRSQPLVLGKATGQRAGLGQPITARRRREPLCSDGPLDTRRVSESCCPCVHDIESCASTTVPVSGESLLRPRSSAAPSGVEGPRRGEIPIRQRRTAGHYRSHTSPERDVLRLAVRDGEHPRTQRGMVRFGGVADLAYARRSAPFVSSSLMPVAALG